MTGGSEPPHVVSTPKPKISNQTFAEILNTSVSITEIRRAHTELRRWLDAEKNAIKKRDKLGGRGPWVDNGGNL